MSLGLSISMNLSGFEFEYESGYGFEYESRFGSGFECESGSGFECGCEAKSEYESGSRC